MSISQSEFIKTDIISIFTKILTDVIERSHGLDDNEQNLLWDNCIKSNSQDGLITMLSKAMADKKDLFIVYEQALNVIRQATLEESNKIRSDYESSAQSAIGVFISFKNYTKSDMIKLYSGFEYCTISSLNKNMNLSKAIQYKINDLRSSTGLNDSTIVKAQAVTIAKSLSNGKDVMLDAKDIIETATPDLNSTDAAIKFLNQKRSFYLGLPASYISGELMSGLGDSGEGDTKAIERGLKNYFFSIIKPVLESIFNKPITYKSQDFRQISQGLEALKTFALIDDQFLDSESKTNIINQLFDIDTDSGSDKQ
jgi:hypothetical protein